MIWVVAIVAALAVVGFVISYRFGLPPRWPMDDSGYPVSFQDDVETQGFKPDWDEYREKPPPHADPRPDWDS